MKNFFQKLDFPRDAAGLAVFRSFFGLLMFALCIRFIVNGWVESLYIKPTYFFSYYGFEWIRPWPGMGMYVHFFVMALATIGIAFGAWYRFSCFLFFLLFTYIELIDKTPYLNHYYLVSLISFLLIFVPAHQSYAFDAWRNSGHSHHLVPRWSYEILKVQIAIVYLFAGIAKINEDWLLHAQPLRTWLSSKKDFPILGTFITETWFAFLMSWIGTLYDLGIVFFLSYPRTRFWAFLSVCVFHGLTALLFPIGMFPWIMIICSTLFFDPSWPRKLIQKIFAKKVCISNNKKSFKKISILSFSFLCTFASLQILIPLRHLIYPGDVNWTEEGFRFSWRVMLTEKEGHVEYTVKGKKTGNIWTVFPHQKLTAFQYKMMSTQADMVHQYAHHLAEVYEKQKGEPVEVYAYAWCTFNGRESREYIDPNVDLASIPISFAPKSWIRKY